MVDWFAVLSPFPQHHVDAAFSEWLREGKRRPSPAEIRDLTLRHLSASMARDRVALPAPVEPEREVATEEQRARILAEFGMSEGRMNAILGGRRMPPPNRPGHVEPEPKPQLTPEEIAARPYTEAELERMRLLRAQPETGMRA